MIHIYINFKNANLTLALERLMLQKEKAKEENKIHKLHRPVHLFFALKTKK
jgi:hypothetical protein